MHIYCFEHENNIISHVMCGFNFFDPMVMKPETKPASIQIWGTEGNMRLIWL